MNKKVKKSFSLLLSVLMLVSCVSIGAAPAYAADLNTSALDAIIDKANAINAEDYTDVSSLTAAVESAKNTELDTQVKIDDMTAKIQLEILKLEKGVESTTEDAHFISKIDSSKLGSYSSNTWVGVFTDAYNAYKAKSFNAASQENISSKNEVFNKTKNSGGQTYDNLWPIGNTTDSVFEYAYAYYLLDRNKLQDMSELGNKTLGLQTGDRNGGIHRTNTYLLGDTKGKQCTVTSYNGEELTYSTDYSELVICNNTSNHSHIWYITSYSPLNGALPQAGDGVKFLFCVRNEKLGTNNAILNVTNCLGIQIDAYDTTALREAIAKSVDSKSVYSTLSYSVYLSALENAMNVLNTPVTVKVNEDDEANYDDIAAAQEAIDNATQRLNNAYNALDKDFVIEYYSDGELFGSQTVLYSDIYTDKLISATPTKAGYVFTAWTSDNGNKYTSDDLTSALAPSNGGKVKLNAEFEANEYTVTFVNYDGEVLETKTIEYGHTVDYTGETPEKPADGDNVYTFTGWDKDITSPITSDTVFTAVFNTHTHEFTELIKVTKEANCTQTGKAVYACECGETKEIETPINPDNHDLIHHEAKAPTCSENGHIAYDVCSRCDYNTYEEIPLDPTAHKYGEWITDGEADCLTGGTKHRVCEYNESHIETAEIPATGAHTYDDGEVTTEPTCSREGVRTYTCSVCGTIKTEIIPINPDAHSYGEFVIVKDETCTTDGEMRKVCKYNDNHIISEIIPASGHNIVHHDGKAATCASEGYKPYDTCSKCDYSTYEKTAKLSHNFVLSKHKDSTCSEKGYDLYKCTLCSDTKKTELALKSHTWDDGVITKEPTSESNGEKTYTCKVCGLTKTAKLYLCSHCNEVFEGDDSYNEHIADVGSVCPYCGQKHDKYLEHMTFVKLKCFLTRLFNLIFGFFKGLK